MAVVFTKLPSRKDYPDYYQVITQPLSLEEIKVSRLNHLHALVSPYLCNVQNGLNNDTYPNVRAVKEAFDTMFNNAKHYNMPDSGIWVDADMLHVR